MLPPAPPGTMRTSLGVSPPRDHAGLGPNQDVEPDVADHDDRRVGHARLAERRQRDGHLGGQGGVGEDQLDVGAQALPSECSWKYSTGGA